MQITESIVAQISRKTFNQMFDPALRRSKVLMSGNGSSVNWAENAGHANSADSLTDLSQIESMLADYVSDTELETTLASYATKTWVDQNYLSLSFFNALFQARTSQGATVAPNSGDTTTIDNIKAMFGFWTDQYISALGQGADGGAITSLAALTDVQLSVPLADGEVLTYSTTLGKWTNGAGVSTAWANITGKPTTIAGYGITDAHITNGVITLGANSITPITSLSGYATESWVNTLLADYVTTSALATTLADYVTTSALATTLADYGSKTWIDNNYVSKAFFNRLFQAFAPLAEGQTEPTQVEPNDTTTTIDNIKAMFGLWTEQYLSALGLSAGGGGGYTLNEPLSSINSAALGTPSQANVAIIWNGTAWTYGTTMSSVSWSDVTNKPTTLAGYGITDAYISNGTITLGANSITPVTSLSGYATQSWVNTQLGSYLPLTAGSSKAITGVLYTNKIINLGDAANNAIRTRGIEGADIDGNLSELYINNNNIANVYINSNGGSVGIGTFTLTDTLTVNGSISADWINLARSASVGGIKFGGATVIRVNANGSTILCSHDGEIHFRPSGDNSDSATISTSGITATSFIKTNGTSSQFLKADGSVDSNSYVTSSGVTSVATGTGLTGGTITSTGTISISSTYQTYISHGESAYNSLSSYLPLSGGSLSGVLNISKNNTPDLLNLYRTSAGGGAYVAYYPLNQTTNFWRVGSGTDYSFNWLYNGSVYGSLDTSGNFTISGDFYTTKNITYDSWKLSVNNQTIIRVHPQALVLSLYDASDGAILLRASSTTDTSGTKQMTIRSNGTAGIGTATPSHKWDVIGQGYYSDTLYTNQIINIGATAKAIRTRGLDGSTADGTTAENLYINQNHNGYVFICNGGGNVGIGSNTANYKLHVSGDIYATGGVTALSDERHKTIVEDTRLQVSDIARMRAVRYLWDDGREDKGIHVGSIAQDWQQILPEVVLRANNDEGTLSLQYGVAALISSITIARKVVNQEQRITELEKECERLRFENEQLKLKIA